MLHQAGLEREMLFTTLPEWPVSSVGIQSIRIAQTLFLFGLLSICEPAIAFCANEIDDTTEILGFHGKSGISELGVRECKSINHSIFNEILTVLQRETGHFDLHPQLRSCPLDEFVAHTRPSRDHGRLYYVDMPESPQFSADILNAVFAHELYHVFQYARFGSALKVMTHYGSDVKFVELAADFGAGYLLSKTNLPNVYEINPELAGGFALTRNDSHGTPSERSSAFRRGLHFTRQVSAAFSMESAEEHFLTFGQW